MILFRPEPITQQTLIIVLLSRETVSRGYGAEVSISAYFPAQSVGSKMALRWGE